MTADDPTANVAYAAYVAHISSGGVEYEAVRAALEAAVPLPAPQPVVDREALRDQIAAVLLYEEGSEWADDTNRHYELADAVLALINGTAK